MSRCPTCGAPRKQRSGQSHDHYFAVVAQAFENLPEDIAGDFADEEHLRSWALIKAGYRKQRSVLCDSEEDARRVAALTRLAVPLEVVQVTGTIVTIYRAESQSFKAMGKERFQQSKEAVLRVLSEMLGCDVAELAAAA